jgi:hypothetical protein
MYWKYSIEWENINHLKIVQMSNAWESKAYKTETKIFKSLYFMKMSSLVSLK